MEIEILIDKIKRRDVKAFEEMYNMYSNSVQGIIFNVVRDESMASELTQDVFVKVWNNIDSYSKEKGRFFTWILNISRNAAIDKTRSREFKESKKNQHSDYFVDLVGGEDHLNDQTDAIGIKKWVEQLSEKCIAVIEFLYFQGFTQKETSEKLAMPLGSVKTKIKSCLGQLRNNLNLN